ncbi:enoyl-CoA hydratase/isomerase family protein, partial [Sciscionella sediminilitoris]|uniref:enoyl-CoA hydratase/isomerase family protein n=1 Tax=Sciscionella sediminilitoris TaxID=1445613 RepID=UPI0004DF88D0
MTYIRTEITGPIATLTIDRPDKLNALCVELMRELHTALEAAEQDEHVKVVVLRGGER